MNRIRINTGKIGLVFNNGDYKKVITEGAYWFFSDDVLEYDMTKPFNPSIDLSILLKDVKLASMLTVVEVKDNEIALQYENGNFKNVLTPGRYAFWKGITEYTFVKADLSKIAVTENIDINTIMRKEVLPYVRVFVVESFEKGILLIDGQFSKILETGVFTSGRMLL